MLTVGPCDSLCFVTWRICHHFTFQKGQGEAGDVCVLLGETRLDIQLCGGWAGGLHRSQPEQRAGCSHWGCWGRCQARTGRFLCSLEKQKGFVGVSLSLRQHYHKQAWTSAPLVKPLVSCWAQIPEPCFVSAVLSSPPSYWKQHGTDWQCVLRAPVLGSFQQLSLFPCC